MPKTKPLHSANISLTKRLLIAARWVYRTRLALSVTFGDTSPKGRGFQKMIFAVVARAALMRSAGTQQTCVPMRPPET